MSIKDGWFTENTTLWPGQAMSLEVDEVLFHEQSKYQVTFLKTLIFKRTFSFSKVKLMEMFLYLMESFKQRTEMK
jgi:spermidine synthase